MLRQLERSFTPNKKLDHPSEWAATSSPWALSKASRKCSPRRPEGPAALPRRKLRAAFTTSATAKSGTAPTGQGPESSRLGRAGGAVGCLCRRAAMTAAFFSRSGGSTREAQARESSPSAANAKQRAWRAARSVSSSSSLSVGCGRRRCRLERSGSQSSWRSPSSHRAHRRWVKEAA